MILDHRELKTVCGNRDFKKGTVAMEMEDARHHADRTMCSNEQGTKRTHENVSELEAAKVST